MGETPKNTGKMPVLLPILRTSQILRKRQAKYEREWQGRDFRLRSSQIFS
jgi:hypothetical protein